MLSLSKHNCYSPLLKEREYNGNKYHLHYCYDCACKLFPEIPDKKFALNPATNRSKFLFEIRDEDFKVVTDKICLRTQDYYIQKFGQEEGLKKWNSYCKKQAQTNTFEYKNKKFGWTKEQFTNYNKKRSCTLQNFIERHGEELGKEKWNEYIQKQRYTTSLEYFIEKYGIKKGTQKFMNFSLARQGLYSHSMICDEFCSKLIQNFPDNKIICHYKNENEFCVDKKYFVDYYDQTLNIVVEFYGDYWHYNPQFYNSDYNDFDKVKQKWESDNNRIKYIEDYLQTKVFIIWENDYRKEPDKIINNLVDKIKSYKNML